MNESLISTKNIKQFIKKKEYFYEGLGNNILSFFCILATFHGLKSSTIMKIERAYIIREEGTFLPKEIFPIEIMRHSPFSREGKRR